MVMKIILLLALVTSILVSCTSQTGILTATGSITITPAFTPPTQTPSHSQDSTITPSPLSASQSSSNAQPTEENGLLPGRIYFWSPIGKRSRYAYVDPNELRRFYAPWEISEPYIAPHDGFDLAFSGHSGEIAYVTNQSDSNFQLWIADLELNNINLLWSDEENLLDYYDRYEDVDIFWGPGNQSIIIKLFADLAGNSKTVFVFSFKSGTANIWQGSCETIITSAAMEQFAIGCEITEDGELKYGIIEFDGSIRIASSLPEKSIDEIVEWAYSSDGNRLLYARTSGEVAIIDSAGATLVLPVSFFPVSEPSHTRRGLKWSSDGSLVLVYGYGAIDNACPGTTDAFPSMPCWMLIDSEAGAITWLPPADGDTGNDAAISPDGKWIVTSIWRISFPRTGIIISIESGEVMYIEEDPFGYVLWVD